MDKPTIDRVLSNPTEILFPGFFVLGCGPEQSIQVREAVLKRFRRFLNSGEEPRGHKTDEFQNHKPLPVPHVFLSTCDRVELYLSMEERAGLSEFAVEIQGLLSARSDGDSEIFRLDGVAAIRHLFRVASGLESPLIGENQILGQVRDAYETSRKVSLLDPLSHRVFQSSIAAGRNVRNISGLNRGAVSHGQAVQSMLVKEGLVGPGFKYVFVGANPMLETVLKYLAVQGSGAVLIGNRSVDRAQELAERYGAGFFGLDQLASTLADADVLISATSAPHHLIGLQHFEHRDPNRGLRVFDLAVPRDLDPVVAQTYKVDISTVSDVEEAVARAIEGRRSKVAAAEQELERQVELLKMSEIRRSERAAQQSITSK